MIDGTVVPGLTPEMFGDDAHLNETGKTIFSRFLAERILSAQ